MSEEKVKVVKGTVRWQHSANLTSRIGLLPLLLLLSISLAGAQEGNQSTHPDPLPVIVQSMERAQSEIQLPIRVTREYHLGSTAKLAADSEVVAEVDFTLPGRYVIQKRDGSGRAEQVVRNILQHEIEIASSVQKSQSRAFSTQNYDFAYLGQTMRNGHRCYLLQINPKRAQPELVSGRAWIDQESFLIRRVEGNLAKSPSWWIKSVHVEINFSTFLDSWVQTTMDAVADVRCFGIRELTSQILSYDTARLAAQNLDRWSTPARRP